MRTVPDYLTPEWIAALDEVARNHAGLAAATVGRHLVIEQIVTGATAGASGPKDADGDNSVCWHVTIDDGTVRFVAGAAAEPTLRFITDRATAGEIMAGTTTTQTAFMTGRLQVGGDTTALLAHHDVLAGLGDVFATVDTNP